MLGSFRQNAGLYWVVQLFLNISKILLRLLKILCVGKLNHFYFSPWLSESLWNGILGQPLRCLRQWCCATGEFVDF